MSDATQYAKNHKNVIQGVSGTVASIGLEKVGQKVAGSLVTPATWGLNYLAEGSAPSVVDVGIWGSGFFSGPASIVTGVVKAFVDDDIAQKIARIQAKEPPKYAAYIKACYNYGMASPSINAMTIANRGGTAWISSIGLWVYITDEDDKLVCDYQPLDFVTMYRPKSPLKAKKEGGFDWGVIRRRR